VSPVVDHPHAQEQRPGGDAVVEHLQNRPFDAMRIEHENPQCHETHVPDAGVGDEFLHVGLCQRHVRAPQDGDQRQGNHDRCIGNARVRHHGQAESQEAIGTHFQHHAGHYHATGGSRLDVRIGKPGVKRKHRNLDREAQEERPENPELRGLAVGSGRKFLDVEGFAAHEVQRQYRHQQRQAAQQGVQEKLGRGVDAARTAPHTDDEVHRNEHRLPQEIEQNEIERREHPDHRHLHDQQRHHEFLDPGSDGPPRAQHA